MPQTSFALMTTLGRAKEAAAIANAGTIEITHIAIGDGATVPSGGETELYNEVDRKAISGHGVVVGASNTAYFDIFLAADDGPYTITEAGLIDADGDLIAIARYNPAINKPTPDSGQTIEGTIRLEVAFSNASVVNVIVAPEMQVALQRLTVLPWIPVLSMTLATPPASPAAGDTYLIAAAATGVWSGHSGKIAEYTAAGWAIVDPPNGHGISLDDRRVFIRVDGTYEELSASEIFKGLVELATVEEAEVGEDTERAVTPAGLAAAIAAIEQAAAGRVLMIDVTERASDQPASAEADGIVRTVTPRRGANGRFYLAAIEHGSRDPGGVQTGSQIKLKRSIGAGATETLSTKRLNHYTATSGQDVIGTSVIFAYDPEDAGGDTVTVRVSHQPLGSGEASTFYAGSTLAILEIGFDE